jgi:hypothetical protein
VLVGRGCEQQPGAVGGPAGDDHELGFKRLLLATVVDHHPGDRRSGFVGLKPDRLRVGQKRHVRVLDRRPHRDHLGVRFCVHKTREAVAVIAPDALAKRHVGLVEQNPAGGVERVQTGLGEASQFCGSRGSQSPRSSSRIRLPDDAMRCTIVPPPAPLPITITSYELLIR